MMKHYVEPPIPPRQMNGRRPEPPESPPPMSEDDFDRLFGGEPVVTPTYVERTVPRAETTRKRFALEPFEDIKLSASGEWLVKKLIPRTGTGILFGESQSFKTFTALDLVLHIALGWQWAGRPVTQAPVVYIAAEGAAGVRKRKIGFEKAHEGISEPVQFYLISAAPNLGVGQDDLRALIDAIEATGVVPGVIVIDTISKSLGGGDENGAGMIQLLANMEALAVRFGAFVLAVHHVGLGDTTRERGHSSTQGGTDVRILCERKDKGLSAVMRWQKLKDEDCDVMLRADVSRIVIAHDEDGDEISTLVVDDVRDADEAPKSAAPTRSIPAAQRLLMETVTDAIHEAGVDFKPFPQGPTVRAVPDEIVRKRYYDRIAEKPVGDETPETLAERQRKSFNRAIRANCDAKRLVAGDRNGERVLWLP